MILYIHGFASCGLGRKSRLLQQHFGPKKVLTPDLPHSPLAAVDTLEALLKQHPIRLLVGSSLGGYLATWLNRERHIPAVLINPAIAPELLLEDYLGTHEDCHGRTFEVTPQTLEELRSMHRHELRPEEPYLVLLQTGDEILDYRQAASYYATKDVIVEKGGSHRFENLSAYLPQIEQWSRSHEPKDKAPA